MYNNDIGFSRRTIPISPPKELAITKEPSVTNKIVAVTSTPEQTQTKTTTVPVSSTSTNNTVGIAEKTNNAVSKVYEAEKKAIENAASNTPTLSEVQSWILKNELLVGIIAVIVIILVIIMIM